MTSLTIRAATPADYPAVARVTVAAYEADGQLKGEHGYGAVLADVASRASHGEVLVAVEDDTGAILGSVTLVLPGSRYAEISGPGELEFRMLAVDPSAQGRGAGVALVRACVDRARDSGCAALVICVRHGHAATAQRLYERLGFVRTPERDWSPAPEVELLALRLDLSGPADSSA